MECRDIPIFFVLLLIRFYKWVELQLLRMFRPVVERQVIQSLEQVGAVVEIEGLSHRLKDPEAPHKVPGGKYAHLPPLHVRFHDRDVLLEIANEGPNLALGEAFMDGRWEASDHVELARRFMREDLFLEYFNPWNKFLNHLQLTHFNLQTESKAWEVGRKHYDLGNDLFQSFLDPWMQYSCGYWPEPQMTLEQAQLRKLDLIGRKLKLKPGMTVLDIGCGWGGLCKYLAENYGVKCVGITISKEGAAYAREWCRGLPVDIRLMDYRNLRETFDRIVSVGMMEHVGVNNYKEYFKVAHRCLKPDGIFLLHTIGVQHPQMVRVEPFYHKYIFPNGSLPYFRDMTKYSEGLFFLEDWHNFGPDYAKTLLSWQANFERNWGKLSGGGNRYDERFNRMWRYYLMASASMFKSRRITLWQIVFSKDGLDEYRAER